MDCNLYYSSFYVKEDVDVVFEAHPCGAIRANLSAMCVENNSISRSGGVCMLAQWQ